MPNYFYAFNQTTNADDTPVQVLINGDTAFVAQEASLAALGTNSEVFTDNGIVGVSTRLTINGDIHAAQNHAIKMEFAPQTITVGATGSISAHLDGINVHNATISNAGSIQAGSTAAIVFNNGTMLNTGQMIGNVVGAYFFNGANNFLRNSGQIIGGVNGVKIDNADARISNHGDIVGGSETAISFHNNAGTLFLDNTGTISGQINIAGFTNPVTLATVEIRNSGTLTSNRATSPVIVGSFGPDFVVNSGRINDDVFLNGGVDIYDGAHGVIAGKVFGGPGADMLIGGEGIDHLLGESDADILTGNGGDDTLQGGLGADSMNGGAGNDTFFVHDASAAVIEPLGSGFDTVRAFVSYTLPFGEEIEVLIGFSFGGLVLGGNEFDNRIYGASGADELSGNLGNDRLYGGSDGDLMRGGEGNDWYFVDDPGDVLIELEGEGADRVFTSASYTLTAQAEIEIFSTDNHLGTSAINLTGNELPNLIYGNAGANTLDGKAGADIMIGMGGNDFYYVDNTLDVVNELADGTLGGTGDRVFAAVDYVLKPGSGVDLFTTISNGATTPIDLNGNELVNTIFGNAGVNILNGGAGKDTISGFGGNDIFFFNTALNQAPGPAFAALPNTANVDRLVDFNTGDTIRLENAIFTALAAGALPAAAYNSGAAASDATDRIIYNGATGALIYDADGTGATPAQLFAFLPTGLPLATISDLTFTVV